MSKTYCRFCDITVNGLYLHCPRCGGWLPPKDTLPEGEKGVINSEPFELVEFGKSWDYKTVTTLSMQFAQEGGEDMNENTTKELQRRRAQRPKHYSLPVRIVLGIIEAILYLIFAAIALGILALVVAGFAWVITKVAL